MASNISMHPLKSFKDPELSQSLVKKIKLLAHKLSAKRGRPIQIMEVCGGHTHTLFRYGIPQLFEGDIEFVHGPGCPVCVLPREVIDQCVTWAQQSDVTIATFGDAIRVPGSQSSLQEARASGANIEVVYSPLDALNFAKQHPDRKVIFLALGFDTTMPSTALTIQQAAKEQCKNFFVYAVHITIIPTLKTVLEDADIVLDGLIGPGHVSMVIGTQPYEFIAKEYALPFVVAGFELLDVLQSVYMVLKQLEGIERGESASIENQYSRTVIPEGNAAAMKAVNAVYAPKAKSFWQGLGAQADLGVEIRPLYESFDAEKQFAPISENTHKQARETNPVYCDDVIMGRINPGECPNFGKGCQPSHPLGALMVSNEGACAAWYQYSAESETSGQGFAKTDTEESIEAE